MRFQLSALQFGKELLQVESQTEQIEFCGDVRLSPHEEVSELVVVFQNAKSSFYLNRAIHPQQSSALKDETFQRFGPVFSRFHAYLNYCSCPDHWIWNTSHEENIQSNPHTSNNSLSKQSHSLSSRWNGRRVVFFHRHRGLNWTIIYNDPLTYAELILNGEPEEYLRNVAGGHVLEDRG